MQNLSRRAHALSFRRGQNRDNAAFACSAARAISPTLRGGPPSDFTDTHSILLPDRPGCCNDEPELRLLLRLGQRIAGGGARKTALRTDRQLIKRNMLRRFLDPAAQGINALESRGLAADETQHNAFAAR